MRFIAACGIGLLLLTSVVSAAEKSAPPKYEPTSNYPSRNVEGWTIYVNHRLLADQKELGDRALEQLRVKLYDIRRTLPKRAVDRLRQVPIWLEFKHPRHPCACYHPNRQWLIENDFNPEKAGAVEIANAATFLDWIRQQPSMVLHELAHGYHHRFLTGGYGNAELAEAYNRAKQSKAYEKVLHCNGRPARAYALNNPQEYFAELTEAWFGTNDFYPFVRAEVLQHDPEMAKLLKAIWTDGKAAKD